MQAMIGRRDISVLAIMAVALSACGFEPLMGQVAHPQVQSDMQRIRVAHIPDRSGQILHNYLLDSLTPRGIQGSELYNLTVKLYEPRREVAIRRDDTASRIAYAATANFTLYDRRSRPLFAGAASAESTYEVTTSEYATLASLASARDRVLQDVSSDIRQQIATFLAGKAPPQEPGR